ncbi:MAG: hypothetical protein AAGC86_04895 [Pseudomonadota bacterium]
MAMESSFEKATLDLIRRNASENHPFHVARWPQATSFLGVPDRVRTSGGFLQEALARLDVRIGRLKPELESLGIAQNTLVILMADNGPMTHNAAQGFVETLHRVGKGGLFDGALRVP